MTDYVVTTLDDENDAGVTVAAPGGSGLSLREAIALADPNGEADTITFAAGLSGGVIRLTLGTLIINDSGGVKIDGDIDDDGTPDIIITGDKNDNDTTVFGTDITDIPASNLAGTLSDNVRIFLNLFLSNLTLEGLVLTGGVDNGGMGGGAVQSDSQPVASLTIRNSVISGNASPVAGSGFGGAISGNGVTVENSTISGNVASLFGGGIYANDLNVSNSTINGNSAGSGGGIYAYGDNMIIDNSTISGNSATSDDGGGLFVAGFMTGVDITSSTFSGNSASGAGGGIIANFNDNVILTNSIVLGNSAPTDAEISSNGITLVGGNILGTDVYRDSADVGDTSAEEVFATVTTTDAGHLADNGGPVRTIALKASASNPALDASDNSALATDARGEARVDQTLVTDSYANGTSADLGAFELENAAPAVVASGGATTAPEQTASVIDAVLHLTDADSVVLASAKVVITGGFRPGEDVLAFVNDNATMGDIAGVYAAGVLTLTSLSGATVDQFQAALRAVIYINTSDTPDPTNRLITFSASDGLSAGAPATKVVTVAPVDDAPTAVAVLPTITSLAEMLAGSPPPVLAKLADIVVTDSDGGSNILGLAGPDAAYLRIAGNELFLRDGTILDFETKSSYSVFVTVDDGTGTTPDATSLPYTLFVSNISPETILGTGLADTLAGGSDTDRMFGLAGNDKLFGNGGNDRLLGAAGNDILAGGDGVDTLGGAAGNDILAGGAGVDTLAGGFGRDTMTGGAARDIFDFNLAAETGKTLFTRDVIRDFSHFQGDDIDLSTIDAMTGVFGNQKFTFIGQSAFTGVKGQLHFTFAGPAKTIVEGDTDGNGLADFQIELTGHKLLVQGDFIL